MNITNWIEIPVADMPRGKAFYEAIFEIELESFKPGGPIEMAIFPAIEKGAHGALVYGPGFYTPSHEGTLVYLNANPDLNAVLQRIPAAGGKIIKPKSLISEEHGYMALFEDAEGNRLALHSDA